MTRLMTRYRISWRVKSLRNVRTYISLDPFVVIRLFSCPRNNHDDLDLHVVLYFGQPNFESPELGERTNAAMAFWR